MEGYIQNSTHEVEVTPNDSTDLTQAGVSFYVEVGGDIKYDTVGGETITKAVANNSYHKIQIKRVYSTGTTATGIFVQY